MKHLVFLFALSLFPFNASAQVAEQSIDTPGTRIVVDEDNHIIRFIIDGEEAARLTKDGFSARKNIGYGGTMGDFGRDGFEPEPAEIDNTEEALEGVDGE